MSSTEKIKTTATKRKKKQIQEKKKRRKKEKYLEFPELHALLGWKGCHWVESNVTLAPQLCLQSPTLGCSDQNLATKRQRQKERRMKKKERNEKGKRRREEKRGEGLWSESEMKRVSGQRELKAMWHSSRTCLQSPTLGCSDQKLKTNDETTHGQKNAKEEKGEKQEVIRTLSVAWMVSGCKCDGPRGLSLPLFHAPFFLLS